jgi:hypothetical protein
VKGAVDACDLPLEARVPRLDRCCLKQKVGYSRDTAPKKMFGYTGGTAMAHGVSLKVIGNYFSDSIPVGTSFHAYFFETGTLSARLVFFNQRFFRVLSAWNIMF